MIAALLLLQALAASPNPLGVLGRQSMPAKGCAAFLWSPGDRTLVAMAGADPARLRIVLDGRTVDLPLAEASGPAGFGFSASGRYALPEVSATLDLAIAERTDLTAGAAIPRATLRLDRIGRDTVVMPLAGLVGCAS